MLKFNPFLRRGTNDEKYRCNTVRYFTEEIDGVTVASLNAQAEEPLNPDFGGGFDIELDFEIKGFVADCRYCEYWCKPIFGTSLSEIPDETQGLILEHTDGLFTVILPIVSKEYKCILKGDENSITAKMLSWYDKLNSIEAPAVAIMTGEDPYELLRLCAKSAVKKLGTALPLREERRYPEIFEYLGWCSWDSMQIRISEEGLVEKCKEFKDKNIPVRWGILDDMWAEIHEFYDGTYHDFRSMIDLMHVGKLYSFDADPVRFPNGLRGAIEKMKEYGLKVGVWHPSTGYWYGIDKSGPIAAALGDDLFTTADGRLIPGPEFIPAFKFYNAFHEFLRECGADFLKIDNQSMIRRFYKNVAPVGKIAKDYHKAMEASVGANFDNNLINCMGMGNEDMWNRPVSAVARCSDDFLPENPEWFSKHILQCSYNDLIQGQFMWCDWDMWWTDDGQAVKNSILRAVSGGPIYVSDKIGRSVKEILDPLTLSDGKILRCDRPAYPTKDCLTVDPETSDKPFKLQNIAGNSGVLALFNLNPESAVTGTISPSDIPGISGEEFAVFEHFSREVKIVAKNETINVTLADRNDFKLYNIVPVKDGFAPIGDITKFIAPKTIKSVIGTQVELFENGTYAYIKDGKLYTEQR